MLAGVESLVPGLGHQSGCTPSSTARFPTFVGRRSDSTRLPCPPQTQQTKFRQTTQPDAEFVPAFAGLDGKVLRFEAFTTEQVPENLTEPFRVRKFTIAYHLVDDSVQINEHKQQNSGHTQGVFMKRHRVPKGTMGKPGEEFVSLFDFADTKTVLLYSREFHLTVLSPRPQPTCKQDADALLCRAATTSRLSSSRSMA